MIKVVHISDLHLSSYQDFLEPLNFLQYCASKPDSLYSVVHLAGLAYYANGHCTELASAAARFIFENFSDYDAIIVSGDLAHTGVEEDLSMALRYVSASPAHANTFLSRHDEPTLSSAGPRIILMPGNHDRFESIVGLPGGAFDAKFSRQWAAGSGRVQWHRLENPQSSEAIVFIMGDFCLNKTTDARPPSYPFVCGQGRAYPAVLSKMKEITCYFRKEEPETGVVWVSHFPPSNTLGGPYNSLRLINYNNVVKAAKSMGVEYILSGHVHTSSLHNYRGVNIVCAGAACTNEEADGNWVHSLVFNVKKGRVKLLRTDYEWDEEEAEFL